MWNNGDQEQRLVERLRRGDSAAMRDFYLCYGGHLTAVCGRYLPDADDQKDVLQDSLVSIFTHIGDFSYRGQGSLRAWSTRIVVNQALRLLKARQRLIAAPLDEDLPDETDLSEGELEGVPDEELYRMVAELPTGYRTVLNLYVFEGKSHQEIAQMLGIKPDTSASQLHRAKQQLAKRLKAFRAIK